MHSGGRCTHRARHHPFRSYSDRTRGRSQTRGHRRIGTHCRLHRIEDGGEEAHRHTSRLRRHPGGRYRMQRIPSDGHRPSRRIPHSGEEGGTGDGHLLAVQGRLPAGASEGRTVRCPWLGYPRCEDPDSIGRRHPRQIPDRCGRIRRRKARSACMLLPRIGGEGLDARIPSGRTLRQDSETRAVHRIRDIRCDTAQGGDERGGEDNRREQRSLGPDTRFRGP